MCPARRYDPLNRASIRRRSSIIPSQSETSLAHAVDAAASLIGQVGTGEFSRSLVDTLTAIIPNTVILVLGAEAGSAPVLLADCMSTRERVCFFNAYMGGAYLLGPGYRTSQDTDFSGICLLRDIFPGDIRTSRYCHMYWGSTGTSDEMFIFIRLNGARTIYISLGRIIGTPKFKKADVKVLSVVESIIRETVCSHWNNRTFEPGQAPISTIDHNRFRGMLDTFGTDILSPRESEVCQLLLRGHSSKSAARVLTISPETERIHRRRVYGKLNVSSQVEVMAKFMTGLAGP
jgi:DNA-binding CsgD family transcriptional regulator